jgi:MFS family permease
MGLYGLAAASGPAIAPVVSGYAVVANGWRWAYWEMLWLSGFSLLLLGFTMPEVGLYFFFLFVSIFFFFFFFFCPPAACLPPSLFFRTTNERDVI